MVGTPGTAAKIFATLAKAGINVMMISQNPSESSITIVVKNTDLEKAVNVLEMELLGKIIKKLEVTTDVAIIALIGSGMRGTIGVASKVFGAIEKNKVNVAMITQGSSELNLAFVVKDSDFKIAVQALHDTFELDKIN
jgi:aspartate kinase